MSRRLMGSKVADVTVGTEADKIPTNSHREITTLSDDDDRIAREIFGVAAAEMGDGKIAAPLLGLSETHLSDMKNGNRTVAAHRLVRARRVNRKAGIAVVRMLAKLIGDVHVVERRPVDKKELRKQLILSLERNPAMFRLALADASQSLGVDPDKAAEVWSEPADEFDQGGEQ